MLEQYQLQDGHPSLKPYLNLRMLELDQYKIQEENPSLKPYLWSMHLRSLLRTEPISLELLEQILPQDGIPSLRPYLKHLKLHYFVRMVLLLH